MVDIEFASTVSEDIEDQKNVELINKVFGSDSYMKYIRAVNKKKAIKIDKEFIKEQLSDFNIEESIKEIEYNGSNKITHMLFVKIPDGTEARRLKYGAFGITAEYLGENISLLVMSEDLVEKLECNKFYILFGNYYQREYDGNLYHNMKVYDVVDLEELQ